ncbi:unnamed protein product [Meloidogyne enterolobii]|uniref:Uncharacterized protein n=1 Tax=Meloidogyne enterolobii TaxID=390850 RepID=A0ACB1AWS8_MELEN
MVNKDAGNSGNNNEGGCSTLGQQTKKHSVTSQTFALQVETCCCEDRLAKLERKSKKKECVCF